LGVEDLVSATALRSELDLRTSREPLLPDIAANRFYGYDASNLFAS
jgi:hypothetical protein